MSTERGRKKPRAEVSGAVLGHIEERGRLHGFTVPRRDRLLLMKSALEQGLIVWNKSVGKYELTGFGHKHLEEYRHKIATGV